MKPRHLLAESQIEGEGRMLLFEQDGSYSINFAGQELMHSRAKSSEALLGQIGVAHLKRHSAATVLVGGLGLGITLRAVVESADEKVAIEVVELSADVVEWNRTFLKELNGGAMERPNVTAIEGDVVAQIKSRALRSLDAILLDIDNGPIAMVTEGNHHLYSTAGLKAIRRALKVGGRAVFWSAKPDREFEQRLRQTKFQVEAVPAKVHANAKRAAYMLYIAERLRG